MQNNFAAPPSTSIDHIQANQLTFEDESGPTTPTNVAQFPANDSPHARQANTLAFTTTNAGPLEGGQQVTVKFQHKKTFWQVHLWAVEVSATKDAIMLLMPNGYPSISCEVGAKLTLTYNSRSFAVAWTNAVGHFTQITPQLQILSFLRLDDTLLSQ